MELLVGETLEAILERERQLEPSRACELLLQACEGLASAHAAEVSHRGIKPANPFVTRAEDGGARLKVLDSGISKVVVSTAEAALTQTQTTMGTPLYMAPEQMRSSRGVDQRADVWALGAVLYRCLSARPAFAADSLLKVASLVLDADYPPLDRVAPQVPRPLAQVVHRCLASRPDDRYPDAASLAAALAPFAGEEGELRAARCRRILAAAEPMESTGAVGLGPKGVGETVPGLSGTAPTSSSRRMGSALGRPWAVGLFLGVVVVVVLVLVLVAYSSRFVAARGTGDGRSTPSIVAADASAAAVVLPGVAAATVSAEVPLVVPVLASSASGAAVEEARHPPAAARATPPRSLRPRSIPPDPFADRK